MLLFFPMKQASKAVGDKTANRSVRYTERNFDHQLVNRLEENRQ